MKRSVLIPPPHAIAAEVKASIPCPPFLAEGNPAHGPILAIWRACGLAGAARLGLTSPKQTSMKSACSSGRESAACRPPPSNIPCWNGDQRLSPFMIPMLISNMASGLASMVQSARTNFATCSAATANHALGEAWRTLKWVMPAILAGGAGDHPAVGIAVSAPEGHEHAQHDPQHARGCSTKGEMALSWARERELWCSRNLNMPGRAGRESMRNWPDTGTRQTRII